MAAPNPVHGVDSEVGRLRTVLLHRPGRELARLTPRNSADLLFDGLPWVERAQQEHDHFADALRSHDVEVLLLRDVLVEALAVDAARQQVLERTLSDQRLGDELRRIVAAHLSDLSPAA
jgi:arginine deiminase